MVGSFGSVARRLAGFGAGITAGAQQQRQFNRVESKEALQTALALGAQGINVADVPGFESTLFTEASPSTVAAFKNVASSGAFTKPYEREQARRGREEGRAAIQTGLALGASGIQPSSVPGLEGVLFADADPATRASVSQFMASPELLKPFQAATDKEKREFGLKEREVAAGEARNAIYRDQIAESARRTDALTGLNSERYLGTTSTERRRELGGWAAQTIRSMGMLPEDAFTKDKDDKGREFIVPTEAYERPMNEIIAGALAYVDERGISDPVQARGAIRTYIREAKVAPGTSGTVFGAGAEAPRATLPDPTVVDRALGLSSPGTAAPPRLNPGAARPAPRPAAQDPGALRLGGMDNAPSLNEVIETANAKIAGTSNPADRAYLRKRFTDTIGEAFPEVSTDYLNSKLAR